MNISTKASNSIELYEKVMKGFHNVLKEAEAGMRNMSVTEPNIETTQNDTSLENSEIVRPLLDPPLVKHKGRPKRIKAWVDKQPNKRTTKKKVQLEPTKNSIPQQRRTKNKKSENEENNVLQAKDKFVKQDEIHTLRQDFNMANMRLSPMYNDQHLSFSQMAFENVHNNPVFFSHYTCYPNSRSSPGDTPLT
ncbi:hypothetical protein GIB67_018217 [Kingdonia uniflora]|uniref:Uncharacterized protein n=1 Tax=Kingdonia uniflora TaxID=39325 RepID=A0A7J7NME2_9MAGN|nr:hypothetical protein GIB67_018217 [Kingdonia uniflora]